MVLCEEVVEIRTSGFLCLLQLIFKFCKRAAETNNVEENSIYLKVLQCNPVFIFTNKKACENMRGERHRTKPSKHFFT